MSTLLAMLIAAWTAGPVTFSGTASIYSEYGFVAGVTGDTLVTPRPELRFNLRPTLSLWGVPLSLDILLSTQENNLRQQLDKYRALWNPQELLNGTADLSGLALSIKGLELGSCNPSWSPYTLSGAPVLGGAFEINPWYVYLAGAAGRAQRAVEVSDSTEGAYSRMLGSGKFGFGKKERTHFYLTALYTTDNTNSLSNNMLPNPSDTTVPPADSFEAVRPRENYVLGAEFNLNLWKGAFTLASEVTGSELTRDKRLPVDQAILDSFLDWAPPWVAKTAGGALNPRFSSSFDYAWKVRPTLNALGTKLNGQFEYIGPSYQSLGAPNLRNDNLKLGGGIERDFFDRSVSVSASYSTEHDNVLEVKGLHLKSQTTRFTSWNASLGLSFPDLPYLQVSYSPYTEQNDSSSSFANVVSVSAGHSFQTGTVSHSPGVTVSYSDLRGDPTSDYTNWDACLNYGLGFSFPLSLAASCGYSRSVTAGMPPDKRLYVNVTPSYTAFKIWRNSLSLGGTFGSNTRGDARLTSSVPIWKICDASVMLADAVYRGGDGKGYNYLRLTATLSKSW